jgi:hypothetical protein
MGCFDSRQLAGVEVDTHQHRRSFHILPHQNQKMEETERGYPSVDRFPAPTFASQKQVIWSANACKAIFCTFDVRFFVH